MTVMEILKFQNVFLFTTVWQLARNVHSTSLTTISPPIVRKHLKGKSNTTSVVSTTYQTICTFWYWFSTFSQDYENRHTYVCWLWAYLWCLLVQAAHDYVRTYGCLMGMGTTIQQERKWWLYEHSMETLLWHTPYVRSCAPNESNFCCIANDMNTTKWISKANTKWLWYNDTVRTCECSGLTTEG